MGFCAVFEDTITLPVDAVLAARYLSFLKETSGTQGAVKTAYNALKWLHNFVPDINKFNDPLDNKVVKCVLDSALRSLKIKRNNKLPLSPDIVKNIISSLSDNTSLLDIRNCLIITLAYSLLLRHDEISHISCGHISKINNGLKFIIVASKTDVYKNGKDVFLAKDRGKFSVYGLFFRYLSLAHLSLGDNHFLFGPIIFDNKNKVHRIENHILSYNSYRNILRDKLSSIGLNPNQFGFHSCRSGGASALASSVSQFELMNSGRWKDPRSISHYVSIPEDRRLDISKKLFFHWYDTLTFNL